MQVERVDNEVIIRLPGSIDTTDLEEMVDFIRFKEITSKSKATWDEVDLLVKEIKKGRWKKTGKGYRENETNS